MTEIRTLTPDETDVLELALHGLLPSPPKELYGDARDCIEFTDLENTPVAAFSPENGLTPRQNLALPPGPLAAEGVRLTARRPTEPGAIAVWLSALLTRDEETAVDRSISGSRQVVFVIPSARSAALEAGMPTADLLTYARALAERSTRAAVVVVPWPTAPERFSGLSPGAIAFALGVDRVLTPVEDRVHPIDINERTDRAVRDAIDQVYAPCAAELARAARPQISRRGQVLFFTGLSGSGKSTIAKALGAQLTAEGRAVSLLDGDEVRHHLSKGLGFSVEDRETNVRRIGFVASLVAQHGGTAIAAPIAPFAGGRAAARESADAVGASFHLIWISTPLDVCEARDRKGLYARARAGKIPDFTGISSPYEEPTDAELTIDGSLVPVEDAVALVRELAP